MDFIFFFFNDTATTEIYTLSLHDALPISLSQSTSLPQRVGDLMIAQLAQDLVTTWIISVPLTSGIIYGGDRSEEHTSELQSQSNLVCRLLLEKKKQFIIGFDV